MPIVGSLLSMDLLLRGALCADRYVAGVRLTAEAAPSVGRIPNDPATEPWPRSPLHRQYMPASMLCGSACLCNRADRNPHGLCDHVVVLYAACHAGGRGFESVALIPELSLRL